VAHAPAAFRACRLVWEPAIGATTRLAFDQLWALRTNDEGAHAWYSAKLDPWESPEAFEWGGALAATAAGTAPASYLEEPATREQVQALTASLQAGFQAKPLHHRLGVLWASSKLPDLLDATRKEAIINEVLAKQLSDGGWSLSSLVGPWKRADGTPQEMTSDGYATGLIAFALQQSGISRENPQLKLALAWLATNQSKTEILEGSSAHGFRKQLRFGCSA